MYYRYSARLNKENEQSADLLVGLGEEELGFGLCFLYLPEAIAGLQPRIPLCRERELNLRITGRKWLK